MYNVIGTLCYVWRQWVNFNKKTVMYVIHRLGILILFLCSETLGAKETAKERAAARNHFSKKVALQPFRSFHSLSRTKCIHECKTRRNCAYINYKDAYKVCYLLEETPSLTVIDDYGTHFGRKDEWNMVSILQGGKTFEIFFIRFFS